MIHQAAAMGGLSLVKGVLQRTCMIEPDHAASLHVAGKLGFTRFAHGLYGGRPVVLLERRATANAHAPSA